MSKYEIVREKLAERRPNHTLPQPFYTHEEFYRFDLEAIYGKAWHMAGFVGEIPDPGNYLTLDIGLSPIVVVRNRQGSIQAFHNSCRHRGAKICRDSHGKMVRAVCPYHQWCYDLDGRLLSARRMNDDFQSEEHGLIRVHTETVAGCIYVSLAAEPLPFEPFRSALAPALAPYNLDDAKLAHTVTLPEAANWKLVMENGRECLHCGHGHPELKKIFPVEMGDGPAFFERQKGSPFSRRMSELGLDVPPTFADWWQIARVPTLDGISSYSSDGDPLVRKRLNDANDGFLGSLRWATEPSNFCHMTSDMVISVNVNPIGRVRTNVIAKWMVHKDAVEGEDYNVTRLIHVWNETNKQDRELAENNQRGVNGLGYVPGPYSLEAEPYLTRFVDWYCGTAKAHLDQLAAV